MKHSDKTGNLYGYCRISTPKQSIDRQIRNIKHEYPSAIIVQEAYTGTKMDRPEWSKLCTMVSANDTIIFDSVARMSRNADEGVKEYFELYDRGIELIFLKNSHINTSVYRESSKDKIDLQGTDEDILFEAINRYMKKVAEKQIRLSFEQAEKEVEFLHQRTKEGIETARLNGKQIGQRTGTKLNVKKAKTSKEQIIKYSKAFNGTLSDKDCIKLIGIASNTYYKYKKELLTSASSH